MSSIEGLTPWQRWLGRRAARYAETWWASWLVLDVLLLLMAGLMVAQSWRKLAPVSASETVDAVLAGGLFGVAWAGLAGTPSLRLLGTLYRRCESASERARETPAAGAAVTRPSLGAREERLLAIARQLERDRFVLLRTTWVSLSLMAVAALGVAFWRFRPGSELHPWLGLAMAASAGLALGCALVPAVLPRWMRLACALGDAARDRP
jgi:hypothetical protein